MMGIGSVHGAAAAGGMGDVAARMAAIQTRIESLTGSMRGGVPIIDVPRDPDAAPLADFAAAQAAAFNTAGAAPSTTAAGGAPNVADPIGAGAALAAKLPEHARPWAPAIAEAALKVGVDPTLLASLVRHESNFDPGVVSHAGAIGLAQLMPGTAAGLGVDPHDPLENLAGGARYLRTQLDRFGSVDLALAAYNAGPNRVAQAGGVPRIPETLAYVDRVIATWEQLR